MDTTKWILLNDLCSSDAECCYHCRSNLILLLLLSLMKLIDWLINIIIIIVIIIVIMILWLSSNSFLPQCNTKCVLTYLIINTITITNTLSSGKPPAVVKQLFRTSNALATNLQTGQKHARNNTTTFNLCLTSFPFRFTHGWAAKPSPKTDL